MEVCSSTSLLSRGPPSQFIGKTVSVCVEHKTTNSAECFCREELDFSIEVIGLHEACGMHLDHCR